MTATQAAAPDTPSAPDGAAALAVTGPNRDKLQRILEHLLRSSDNPPLMEQAMRQAIWEAQPGKHYAGGMHRQYLIETVLLLAGLPRGWSWQEFADWCAETDDDEARSRIQTAIDRLAAAPHKDPPHDR